jgi:transcriptional regulator with XRE-family HTH domain
MNWFKKRRETLKITQRHIALRLNMTTSAVSAWENDEAAPRAMLSPKLASVYDVSEAEMDRQIAALAKRIHALATA